MGVNFEKWQQGVLIELNEKYNLAVELEDLDWDAWGLYYKEGYSPSDAVIEDVSCG